jgi:predicted HAD superfamily Cof-like phosphohydrolase
MVTKTLKRFHRLLEPVASQVPFHQLSARLRRRTALLDEMRDVLRLQASLPKQETRQDLEQIHRRLDNWADSLRMGRPSALPACVVDRPD